MIDGTVADVWNFFSSKLSHIYILSATRLTTVNTGCFVTNIYDLGIIFTVDLSCVLLTVKVNNKYTTTTIVARND